MPAEICVSVGDSVTNHDEATTRPEATPPATATGPRRTQNSPQGGCLAALAWRGTLLRTERR
eukprot:scaffold771_cov387-Prasinococcus_capsulatus_cf.AAC.16